MDDVNSVILNALQGQPIDSDEALSLENIDDMPGLVAAAATLRDRRRQPGIITWSPKVFIPLVHLCRDVCHYCTFAQVPKRGQKAYLTPEQVLEIARAGKVAGCHEALFTLGDKPELRYKTARNELRDLGQDSTLSYLRDMAQLVLDETGLLPHLNPGILSRQELLDLRQVSVSQGLMLESSSTRLCEKGGPHYGSPDKQPAVRIETIAAAGSANVPFTSGILIGIGETRRERIESLVALRELHEAHGHLQEIIIQNFRRKPGTIMHAAPEPSLDELVWTIAVARVLFGPDMNIQAPPNLSPRALPQLIDAGINDWGGVSPVTPDHVNPEAAWPQVDQLARTTELAGKHLVPRLPIYPEYLQDPDKWLAVELRTPVLHHVDTEGYARPDNWSPGSGQPVPVTPPVIGTPGIASSLVGLANRAMAGQRLEVAEIEMLFSARGRDYESVCTAANELRQAVNGDQVSYIVNRNINYTNICYYGCGFCAFSKGRVSENLRERGYNLSLEQIQQRTDEAWQRGALEVCLQGGIHPDFTGNTYLSIVRAVKDIQPAMHVHAFSPLEISHGAETLGMTVRSYLEELKQLGLGTLPGTAAEILDDEIRQIICPDKLNTREWLAVIRAAHSVGLNTTSTIMFGHVDAPVNWARHLLHLRDLQEESGGFTEFVPLPYVHMEAPLFRRGNSRCGPTFRETILMHAVSRLVLYPHINNIQASWVKLGLDGVKQCLLAGVNDLGGTLMNESISRAAGASHGQECSPGEMESLILEIGRIPRQRNSTYGDADAERSAVSYMAPVLSHTEAGESQSPSAG